MFCHIGKTSDRQYFDGCADMRSRFKMQYDMTAYEWFPTFFSSTFLNKGLGFVNILLVLLFLRSARVVLASSGDE